MTAASTAAPADRRSARLLRWALLCAVIGCVLGAGTMLVLGALLGAVTTVPLPASAPWFVVAFAAFGVTVGALPFLLVVGWLLTREAAGADRDRSRRLRLAIRGRAAVDPADVPYARAFASVLADWLVLLAIVSVSMAIGLASVQLGETSVVEHAGGALSIGGLHVAIGRAALMIRDVVIGGAALLVLAVAQVTVFAVARSRRFASAA